jgi:hypothetical protein
MKYSEKGQGGRKLCIVLAASCAIVSGTAVRSAGAYDGPTFSKGLWLFQRSTEFYTKHWLLPNARRVKVEQPVVRCVNPTEAMIETFRAASIGSCQSSPPQKRDNTFTFARRCDYLGPVKTVIAVENEAGYRETNELLVGQSPKRDIVVARRLGDCGNTTDLSSAVGPVAPGPTSVTDNGAPAGLDISASRRLNQVAPGLADGPDLP